MNPHAAVILLVYAIGVTWAPWRRPSWRRPAYGLWMEGAGLVLAVGVALELARLAIPTRAGMLWGGVALHVAAYW
jgi:hypothetical protein